MLRSVLLWGLFVFLGVVVVGHQALTGRAEEKAGPPLSAALRQRIDFPAVEDPNSTFDELLDMLRDRHDLKVEVDDAAFRAIGVENVGATPIAPAGRIIKKMRQVPLADVLRKLLERVGTPTGAASATFLVRRDHIEITTANAAAHEIWGEGYAGPYLPLVQSTFEKQPLEKVLRELADEADFTIVLDSRAEDKAKVPVSGRFRNTPLDTAVRLLADMADLKTFLVDNVVYVTSKENAAAMEEQELKKVKQAQEMGGNAPTPRVGLGRFLPAAPAGM
jgi:hypothetical protein